MGLSSDGGPETFSNDPSVDALMKTEKRREHLRVVRRENKKVPLVQEVVDRADGNRGFDICMGSRL